MDDILGPFEQMLASVSGRQVTAEAQWMAIENSGFLDALVAEESGGAGLSLADVEPLIRAAGRYAIEAPFAETMAKRALGVEALDRPLAAVLVVAEIAGLAERVLDMSLSYANDRVQFGQPIGKLQVIQQQLAVLGEQVLLTRMASQIGCAQELSPSPDVVAVSKQVASAAVPQIVSIAHAVHGAIGITEEFDLQRYTRRLHALRLAHGSDGYWAAILGQTRIQAERQSSVEFICNLQQA